jgi:hypothetical protein
MITIELSEIVGFRRYLNQHIANRVSDGDPGDAEAIDGHMQLIQALCSTATIARVPDRVASDLGAYLAGVALDLEDDAGQYATAMRYFGLLLAERARR